MRRSAQAVAQLADLAQARRQAAGRASINAARAHRHRKPVSPRQQKAELDRKRQEIEART